MAGAVTVGADGSHRRSPTREATLRIVPPESFPAAAADVVAEAVRRSVETRGECALALAGGSTPRPVYRQLGESGAVPWGSVDIYFGDERAVPPEAEASNFRMVRESLLAGSSVRPRSIHRMEAEREDLVSAADAYAARLPERLDVLLLGIGEDGHVASLFPGSAALETEEARVVAVSGPTPPPRRLTVTPPVVRGARCVVVLAAGRRKADAVGRALADAGSVRECPARLARGGTWVLDVEAASALPRRRKAAERGRPRSADDGGEGAS